MQRKSPHLHLDIILAQACNCQRHTSNSQVLTVVTLDGTPIHTRLCSIVRGLGSIALHSWHVKQNLMGEVGIHILQKLGGGWGGDGLRVTLGLDVMGVPLRDVTQHVVQGLEQRHDQGWLLLSPPFSHLSLSLSFLRSHGLTFMWWECCSLRLWHKPAELAHCFLFCSCIWFCLYGPFNCILFLKFSRRLPSFSLCSSRLIFALLVFLAESLLQPWYNPLWSTGFKAPAN